MKKLILAMTSALGLASVGGVSLAQNQTTQLQNVVVTGERAYETYVTHLDAGFQLQALVGHTHGQYVQARRAADQLESQRMQGLAQQPVVSVAIDNSAGPGVARQFQLIDANSETVAIVNVYCKRSMPSEGSRCRMAPQATANTPEQGLASVQARGLRVAMVNMRR
ncbi:MAG TPA: hypothetical protein VGU03_07450 [Frateuria sp.]|uniref:hypothetical protein n=1 Tax=Frateuria sp. TaxID=2211372 RepID=UPI002DE7C848|nr:hypothetical protein [Frateuria sp.]